MSELKNKRRVLKDGTITDGKGDILRWSFIYDDPRPIIAPKEKPPPLKASDEFLNLIMQSREEAKLIERKMIIHRLKSLKEKKRLPPELVGDLDLDIEGSYDEDIMEDDIFEDKE